MSAPHVASCRARWASTWQSTAWGSSWARSSSRSTPSGRGSASSASPRGRAAPCPRWRGQRPPKPHDDEPVRGWALKASPLQTPAHFWKSRHNEPPAYSWRRAQQRRRKSMIQLHHKLQPPACRWHVLQPRNAPMLLPASSKRRKQSEWPLCAAMEAGVAPPSHALSLSQPASSRRRKQAAWPFCAAM